MGCQHQPLTAVFIFTSLLGFTHASQIVCVYSKQPMVKFSHLEDKADDYSNNVSSLGEGFSEPRTVDYCVEGSEYCYALWQEDPSNKTDIVILAQGCWGSSAREDCVMNKCISNKEPSKAKNNTKFCCCYGNLCNVNVTDGYIPNTNHTEIVQSALHDVEQASYKKETVIIALATVFSVTMITVASYFILRIWSMTRKSSSDSINLMEAPPPPSPTFDLDSLKIEETVGRGRYGSVCRGTLHEHTVAVKIFNWQNRQYFLNEREIYSLPHMDHPCLAKMIGSEERIGHDGRQEYLLVLSYYPRGCLQDFLRHNTIDWSTLCKMALSTTRGLAHLHTEIKKGNKVKQCIAHRDLTSRNVLVKCDGTCVLCDFGFAMGISGSKYYQHEEEQVAETTSLAEVGTLMYMAPEIIEGAVNLRDCESSLKQIDVYALGLVLWEIATRCTDLFQGVEVPEYRLPFEAEVGLHPTMEQMQVLVTRHKARPLFPDIWKDTNPAVRALKETIEDCWDQDAEARLTTLCVEERLSELPLMWERYKAGINVPGVSPTINHTSNNHQRTAPSVALSSTSSLLSESIVKDNGDLSDSLCLSTKNEFPTRLERMSSVSENTTETVLSPSEPLPPYSSVAINLKNSAANNTMCSIPKVTVPLQPHQGRNPCMERNLMMDSTDEVSVSGNTLLDRHSHYKDDREHGLYPENHDDIFDILPGTGHTENSVLLSNDVLNHSVRASHPISYVQNVVHGGSNMPKQPNVPGNGYKMASASSSVNNKEEKKWKPFGIFDRKKGVWGEQGIKAGLKNFLERRCSSKGGKVLEEEQPLRNSTAVVNKPNSTIEKDKSSVSTYGQPYDCKKTDTAPLVDTEVHMINSNHGNDVTVVCTVANGHVPCVQKTQVHSASQSYPEEHNTDNKNSQSQSVRESIDQQLLDNSETYSDSTKQIINPSILRTKRPTSLPVKGFQYASVEESELDPTEKLVIIECAGDKNKPKVARNGSGKKKGVKRVKTPFEIKGRFSLYDDRIMSSQDSVSSHKNSQLHLNKTALSASLPVDIDSVHT